MEYGKISIRLDQSLIKKLPFLYTIVFTLPFLAVMAFDAFIVKRPYFLAQGDGVQGFFGLGLNWLTGTPYATFHQPAVFWQELSALFISLTGIPEKSLWLFNSMGIWVHILSLVIAGCWVSYIAKTNNIRLLTIFSMSFIAACLPSMIIYSRSWAGPYFIAGVFIIPVVLSSYFSAENKGNSNLNVFMPFFVLGFLCVNYLAFVSLLLPLLLVGIISKIQDKGLKRQSESELYYRPDKLFVIFTVFLLMASMIPQSLWKNHPILLLSFIMIIFVMMLVRSLFPGNFSVSNNPVDERSMFNDLFIYFIILCLSFNLLTPVVTLIPLRSISAITVVLVIRAIFTKWLKSYLYTPIFPLLCGMAVGVNLLQKHWLKSFYLAMKYKGGALSATGNYFSGFNLSEFLLITPWYFIILSGFLISSYVLLKFLFDGKKRNKSDLIMPVFIFGIIFLTSCAIYNIDLSSWSNPLNYGTFSRNFLVLISIPVILLISIEKKWNKSFYYLFIFFGMGVSLLTLNNYYKRISPFASDVIKGANLIDQEFRDDRSIIVGAGWSYLPESCGILYGSLGRYRTLESKDVMDLSTLLDNRVLYFTIGLYCLTDEFLEKYKDRKLIIAYTGPPDDSPPSKVIWYNKGLESSVIMVEASDLIKSRIPPGGTEK